MIRKILKVIISVVFIFAVIWFIQLPEYEIYNSMSFEYGDSIRETDLRIVVYKARYNPILYEEIAEEHNVINGTPTKLTMYLYSSRRAIEKGKNPYRTIVYEYDRNLSYILLK